MRKRLIGDKSIRIIEYLKDKTKLGNDFPNEYETKFFDSDVYIIPYLDEIVFDQSKDFGNQGTLLMDSELYYFLNKPAYLCFVTNTFIMD